MTWLEPFPGEDFDPKVRQLLWEIQKGVVVVGSTARRDKAPKDLDLLLNEGWEDRVRRRVKALGIEFTSAFPGNWTFCEGGYCGHIQVELLPVHRGPDYRTTRKRATVQCILGLELHVAAPEDAL